MSSTTLSGRCLTTTQVWPTLICVPVQINGPNKERSLGGPNDARPSAIMHMLAEPNARFQVRQPSVLHCVDFVLWFAFKVKTYGPAR